MLPQKLNESLTQAVNDRIDAIRILPASSSGENGYTKWLEMQR